MITAQHKQEGLSRSYIHAIAGNAGVNMHLGREFDYGFDGTFRPVIFRNNRRVESGISLDFQLKCTKNWKHENECVAYKIETKTYNDLVTRDPYGVGAILILLCVPRKEELWIRITEASILMRRCCYYFTLSGAPVHNENSTKKILIPRMNLLTGDSLVNLIDAERRRISGDTDAK